MLVRMAADLFAGHHGSQPGARKAAASLPHPDHTLREAHTHVGREPGDVRDGAREWGFFSFERGGHREHLLAAVQIQ